MSKFISSLFSRTTTVTQETPVAPVAQAQAVTAQAPASPVEAAVAAATAQAPTTPTSEGEEKATIADLPDVTAPQAQVHATAQAAPTLAARAAAVAESVAAPAAALAVSFGSGLPGHAASATVNVARDAMHGHIQQSTAHKFAVAAANLAIGAAAAGAVALTAPVSAPLFVATVALSVVSDVYGIGAEAVTYIEGALARPQQGAAEEALALAVHGEAGAAAAQTNLVSVDVAELLDELVTRLETGNDAPVAPQGGEAGTHDAAPASTGLAGLDGAVIPDAV